MRFDLTAFIEARIAKKWDEAGRFKRCRPRVHRVDAHWDSELGVMMVQINGGPIGFAKCAPEDRWSGELGAKIAGGRAVKRLLAAYGVR